MWAHLTVLKLRTMAITAGLVHAFVLVAATHWIGFIGSLNTNPIWDQRILGLWVASIPGTLAAVCAAHVTDWQISLIAMVVLMASTLTYVLFRGVKRPLVAYGITTIAFAGHTGVAVFAALYDSTTPLALISLAALSVLLWGGAIIYFEL
jgi:hypothetical protein